VSLDLPAVPLTEEQIQTILNSREVLLKEDVIEGKREERFIPPSSTGEYQSAQAMIADQPPLPDPVFLPGEVVPCTYDIGAQLNCLDAHEVGFKTMIKEMFEAGPELKLTEDAIRQLVNERGKTDTHYRKD